MATTDIFEKLKNLQEILVKKYNLETKIEEAPKQLSTQEELLNRMKKEYIEKDVEYNVVKAKIGEIKIELDEAVKSRENGEKGMDNITTHREYEALEKQIAEATDKENDLRKQLQKEEKNREEIQDILKQNEETIKSLEDDLNESKNQLQIQLDEYNNELADLKKQEDNITPGLNQEILFKFQRIIQRNSEGIVAVKNGVCTGCHMILPAQFANTVRKISTNEEEEKVLFCPYCSRILFYEESDNDEDEELFLNDLGSLSDLDDLDEDEKREYGFDDSEDGDEDRNEDSEDSEYKENDDDEMDSEIDDEDEDDEEEDDEDLESEEDSE